VFCFVSESHRWWDARLSGSEQFGHHGANCRSAADRCTVSAIPSAEALKRVVTASTANNRSDKDELFRSGSDVRETLADLNTGHGGGYRVKVATDFLWGVCLDFPHVLMRGAAAQKYIDHCLVTPAGWARRFGSEEVWQPETGSASHRKTTDFQKATARNSVTIRHLARTEDGQHGRSPKVGTDAGLNIGS
jgi:hypothetical protein